ncbi:MAG: hypothetical protein UR60_C0022G0040 [Candidatus Moranbacteria bacterium GW2011_GWF2_34_56]|nr:MAG: hypothetical protein UR51_C0010G0014 [Candidatus Moranbacteria bacterium GW2011_GWF1_34_10]KKP64410.1 MAG: hypothetical protein UR60_C0022G0040 [Candidatus Moranbacteria bacterium GW2011_GWF2_34_56]HBI17287.1 hypothetical protein [Candidatus Moranbacteria bacterium]
MKSFLLRISIIFLIILVQINFLDLILLENNLINLSILTLISWIIISGFDKMWLWIVLLGFFNDIFLIEKIGSNVLFFTLFAYLISFISKRFMIERRWSGFLLVVIFILMGNFMGSIFNSLFFDLSSFKEILIHNTINYFTNWVSLVWTTIISAICFYIIYTFINKIEKYIERSENRLKISF